MSNDRIDRLIAGLERILQGSLPRRYWVEFDTLCGSRRARVVEAYSHADAVAAAQIAAHLRGHEPIFVRPALDTDCFGCGGTNLSDPDRFCARCGLSREKQVERMRGEDGLR